MTLDEMYAAVNDAPPEDKLLVAERVLRQYHGEDKELIAPWLFEMAALEQYFPPDQAIIRR